MKQKNKRLASATCIAAIRNKRGKIMVAADRRMSWDTGQVQKMPTAKVVKRDGLIIAGTGSCYLLTLMTQLLVIPTDGQHDPINYTHNILKPAIIKLLKHNGFVDDKKNLKIPEDVDLEAVIVCNGRIFSLVIENVEPDKEDSLGLIMIDEVSLPYATGCGGRLAWGSLLTTEKMKMESRERLELALQVAAEVSSGCDDTIDIVSE